MSNESFCCCVINTKTNLSICPVSSAVLDTVRLTAASQCLTVQAVDKQIVNELANSAVNKCDKDACRVIIGDESSP